MPIPQGTYGVTSQFSLMGKESIKLASEGFTRPWKMRQENKSPSYTTKWEEILVSH